MQNVSTDPFLSARYNFKQVIAYGLVLLLLFLLISSSSLHYWDEYFYIYSVKMHEPFELLTMETSLGGFFPPGFFAGKVGFIYLLDWIVDLIGDGPGSLYTVQAVFSFLIILFVITSYGLLTLLLPQRDAIAVSIILLFMPLVMYFSGKVLTEIPSLPLVVLASLSFLKSFETSQRGKWFWLTLAIVFLFAAAWVRFISVIFFTGMVLGLFAMHDDRFPFWKVFFRAAITGIGAVVLLVIFWLTILEDPAKSIIGLLGHLVDRSQSIIIRLYAVAVFVQFFGLYLVFALWRPWTGIHRFAIVWLLFTTVPFLIGSNYAEPRFFYMALIPFSILVWLGMMRLANLWPKLFGGQRGWLVFALLVGLNRWLLVPLMPSEHDQDAYREIMDKSISEGNAQYLVPWLSDYTLLRLMYPKENIYLTVDWTRNGDKEFFTTSTFRKWIGSPGYLANKEELSHLPLPWRYIGWDYNHVIKRIQLYAELIGLSADGIKEGQKNHFTLSWPWREKQLTKTKLFTVENYEIYDVVPASTHQNGSGR